MTDQTNELMPDADADPNIAPEHDVDLGKMTRDYERERLRVPRLEDILSDVDEPNGPSDAAKRMSDDHYEARPTSGDFVNAPEKPKRRPADNSFGGQFASQFAATFGAQSTPARKSKFSPAVISQDERRWAMLAHASALLTVFAALSSAGILSLFTLFIPLGIYFYWRQKSEFVAFQALQAFTLQIIGTVGWLALLTGGLIVGVLILIALALTVVGLILYVVAIPALILFVVATLALPFAMVVYSCIAAFQTWQGVDYRLPRIGRWIDNQMNSGLLAGD
jgi:uncharacterized Tic20 family protein